MIRFATVLLLVLPVAARAGSQLDHASQEALQKTMQLLQSDASREQVIGKSADAQTADSALKGVAGNQANTDEAYRIASQVFSNLVQETGGDATKLMVIMTEAQKNPQAFYEKYFTAADKASLKQLATKIQNAPTMAKPVNK